MNLKKMRWTLFLVVLTLFCLMTVLTLGTVFFGWFAVDSRYETLLYSLFVAELGVATMALFYSLFGLVRYGRSSASKDTVIQLHFDGMNDPNRFVGHTAEVVLYDAESNVLHEQHCKIFLDYGPRIALRMHKLAHNLFIGVTLGKQNYSGSFAIDSYLVDLVKTNQ